MPYSPDNEIQSAVAKAKARALSQKEAHAHKYASDMQAADRADPFAYSRAYSRIMNDVGEEYARPGR